MQDSYPLITIGIPTYKRIHYLKKLLDSIVSQTFKDFNVVVTDDSNDDSVEKLFAEYTGKFNYTFHKNPSSLGTVENMNKAISLANGKWIKIMHDDDSFSAPDALAKFASATTNNTSIIFSSYFLLNEKTNNTTNNRVSNNRIKLIRNKPYVLLYNNVFGPPSTTMVKNDKKVFYDGRMRWLVDVDYYIGLINNEGFTYIPETMINIGINDSQVTNSCLRNRTIEIPEALFLHEKYGKLLNKTLRQYDSWWRLIRNLEIRNKNEFIAHSNGNPVPAFVLRIIDFQKLIPLKLLKIGVLSKPLMFIHYLLNMWRPY